LPLVLPEASAVGRRKKTDIGERRTSKVLVWLKPSERTKLDKRIAAAGVSAPDYIRPAVLEFRVTPKDPMSEETLSELRACGSVLNQLARRANMSEKIDPQELRNALRHWGEIVEKILASPTRKPMEEELQDDDGDFNEWAESIEKIELEIEREMTK
jgi:hypothetical protein